MEEKIEALAANIYAQLVVAEFYQPNGLDYESMENKARTAAASVYKKWRLCIKYRQILKKSSSPSMVPWPSLGKSTKTLLYRW